MRLTWLVAGATLVTVTGGCGGDDPGGTPPPPTVASLTVTPSAPDTLRSLGKQITLTAVARDAANNVLPNAQISWSSTATGVVTVDPSTGSSTTARAAGNGNATVRATSGSVTADVPFTVRQTLASVVLAPATLPLRVGETGQLTATARDSLGSTISGTSGATFSSSDETKATVGASSGLVTGVSEGTATITGRITHNGVERSGTATVNVTTFPLTATVVAGSTTNTFTPQLVDIRAGGTVTWQFGARTHNVVFANTPGAPADISPTSNAEVARTFPNAGTFDYDCTIHAGMTGKVVVH